MSPLDSKLFIHLSVLGELFGFVKTKFTDDFVRDFGMSAS